MTIDQWQTQRWYKPENRRYYHVELHQDLWGNWKLTSTWGSNVKLGRQNTRYLESLEEGHQLMKIISQQRLTKKYRLQGESGQRFPAKLPNAETMAAMEESRNDSNQKRLKTFADIREEQNV